MHSLARSHVSPSAGRRESVLLQYAAIEHYSRGRCRRIRVRQRATATHAQAREPPLSAGRASPVSWPLYLHLPGPPRSHPSHPGDSVARQRRIRTCAHRPAPELGALRPPPSRWQCQRRPLTSGLSQKPSHHCPQSHRYVGLHPQRSTVCTGGRAQVQQDPSGHPAHLDSDIAHPNAHLNDRSEG